MSKRKDDGSCDVLVQYVRYAHTVYIFKNNQKGDPWIYLELILELRKYNKNANLSMLDSFWTNFIFFWHVVKKSPYFKDNNSSDKTCHKK